jgi:hypothetical protein
LSLNALVGYTANVSALALTNAEKLDGMDWYEFGREWDCICAQCGAVFRSTAANDKWCGCWE